MFLVVEKFSQDVFIGGDFLQAWKIEVDPATEDFITDEKGLPLLFV
jgi:hypothetical protein